MSANDTTMHAEPTESDRPTDKSDLDRSIEVIEYILNSETASLSVAITSNDGESSHPLYSEVESEGLTDRQQAEHHIDHLGALIADTARELGMDPLTVAEHAHRKAQEYDEIAERAAEDRKRRQAFSDRNARLNG